MAEPQHLLPISNLPASDAADGLWLRLLLLSGRCHRQLAHRLTAPDGATASEVMVLACFTELGETCQQSELVERLGSSAAHVSGVVERLRQRGWMTADRTSVDRRRQSWRITATGRDALAGVYFHLGAAKATPALQDLLARLEGALSAADAPLPSATRSSA